MSIREIHLKTVMDVLRWLKPGDDEDSVFQRESAEAHIRELQRPAEPQGDAQVDLVNEIYHMARKYFREAVVPGQAFKKFVMAARVKRPLIAEAEKGEGHATER